MDRLLFRSVELESITECNRVKREEVTVTGAENGVKTLVVIDQKEEGKNGVKSHTRCTIGLTGNVVRVDRPTEGSHRGTI